MAKRTAQKRGGNGSDRRRKDQRTGPPDRRQTYRRGLGRYDRRMTGANEAEVSDVVRALRVGVSDRRGSEARIRRRGPIDRRVAQRRQDPGGKNPTSS